MVYQNPSLNPDLEFLFVMMAFPGFSETPILEPRSRISAGYGGILIAENGKVHDNHTKLMEAMK